PPCSRAPRSPAPRSAAPGPPAAPPPPSARTGYRTSAWPPRADRSAHRGSAHPSADPRAARDPSRPGPGTSTTPSRARRRAPRSSCAGPQTLADYATVRGPDRLVPAAVHDGQPRPGPVQRRRRERRGRRLPALQVLGERLRVTLFVQTHIAACEGAVQGERRE